MSVAGAAIARLLWNSAFVDTRETNRTDEVQSGYDALASEIAMESIKRLLTLHNANFASDIDAESVISEILADYGFNSDADFPGWFKEMLDRLIARHFDTFEFSEVGSDLGSVLQALEQELGWRVDDYGEGVQIDLPNDGLRVDISREHICSNGSSGCSCTISSL